MTGTWLRRALMLATCAAATLLAGCGSSTVSAFTPTRVISFGDAFSDVGNLGVNNKYTVNDGSTDNWAQEVAADFSLALAPSNSGGLGYAQGNARIALTPDAAGSTSTLTVTQQIDSFLATNSFQPGDLVLINGGISDIVYNWQQMVAGHITQAQMSANVAAAANAFGAQVQRLVGAGAKHVIVVGTYDLSDSPWAAAIGQPRLASLLSSTTVQFNDSLLLSIVNLGANVLYIDSAFYFNLVTSVPTAYPPLVNGTSVACTSVDAGAGIGIGAGQVNSSLCTPSTIAAGVNYTTYLFADPLYFAPSAQRLFGDSTYNKIIQRF
ncbi:MAG TPA: SGNH/GDSL hydrolase family protein [Rhodoferax sp.]|nr:SGNH/GDSL hydrolase family protein [Rhodoferax sp.]